MANRITLGNLTIDRDRYEVWIGERCVKLTYLEFELLFCLARKAGTVIPREAILTSVWKEGLGQGRKKLAVHVSRLRKKIAGSCPYAIRTIAKRGYSLADARPAPRVEDRRAHDRHAAPTTAVFHELTQK